MKFIHTADIHLGALPDAGHGWSEERGKEIWESFGDLIDRTNEEEADLLLISGDLFHRQPLLRELKEVNYLFSKLKKTRVVFIIGNHDYLKKDSNYRKYKWNENVYCLSGRDPESIYFKDIDTRVYGMSYHTREITGPLYQACEREREGRFHILLLHGGDQKHMPLQTKALAAKGFDYVALGHIHKPQILVENRIAYAGALEPIDNNDTGAHGYLTGELSGSGCRLLFHEAARRRYIHLVLKVKPGMTGLQIRELLASGIRKRGPQHIYKVRLEGLRDPDLIPDLKELEGLGNIVSVTDQTKPDFDFKELQNTYRNSLIGQYIESFGQEEPDEIEQKALYFGVAALLEAMK